MGKLKSYLMLDEELGEKLMQDYQNEVDGYSDLSPEQVQAELERDPAYIEFIEEVTNCLFEGDRYDS